MMNPLWSRWMLLHLLFAASIASGEPLKPGDAIRMTLRGVPAEEQQKINGEYTVGDDGLVSVPLLDHLVRASGLSPNGFARAVEKAYKSGGIYASPAIDVVALAQEEPQGAVISVGGHIKRGGSVPFRKGMTMLQAIDAAGGRDQFGGRNIHLIRDGHLYVLDFKALRHKNIELKAGDSLQVAQKAAFIDKWKGSEKNLRPLLVN